jgi:imidazolonepropionase-like amidohydrolase
MTKPTSFSFTHLDDAAFLDERARLRRRLERMPANASGRAELERLQEEMTEEFLRRARPPRTANPHRRRTALPGRQGLPGSAGSLRPGARTTTTLNKTALTDVRVFDGERLLEPATIVIDGDRIGAGQAGARTWDGGGRVLLPGLIDCRIHLADDAALAALARHGVTTAFDMGTGSPEVVASLRGRHGVPDVRSGGASATSPASADAKRMGAECLVANPDEAKDYVSRRAAEGVDYIKIIVDLPGFDEATVRALIEAAHAHGLRTIAHAATRECVLFAHAAGVDVLIHAPFDRPLDNSAVQRGRGCGEIVVPTLTMMEAIVARMGDAAPVSYDVARAAVRGWHRAGVPILAGTDANQSATASASPPYGSGLHRELELLVDAGLSAVDALRSATILPAWHFGLADRGVIAPGKRADLVLVDGDPLHDISAVSEIAAVWCAGVLVAGTLSRTEEARSRSRASASMVSLSLSLIRTSFIRVGLQREMFCLSFMASLEWSLDSLMIMV